MTSTEITWLVRHMRLRGSDRIKVWLLGDHNRGRIVFRDSRGKVVARFVRASSCYARMCTLWTGSHHWGIS